MKETTIGQPAEVEVPARLRASVPAHLWELAPEPVLRVEDMSPYRPTRREFLIGAGSLLILAPYGCGGEESGQGGQTTSGGTRAVKHAFGTSEVPRNPERIVTVGNFALDTLLALEVKPVGVRNPGTSPGYLAKRIEDMEGVKGVGGTEPNLETIATLEPDLILGVEAVVEEIYDQLSQIAPTVAPVFEGSGDWKNIHLKFSEALGMEDQGQRILEDYEGRAKEFQNAMGDRLAETTVSILRVSADSLSVYLGGSFAGTVIKDAGLSFPDNQLREDGSADLSKERLGQVEADALFVWTFGAGEELARKEQRALEDLKDDPLWNKLDVVQRGNVCEVGDHWIGSGPLAANLILDDLFKNLVEGENTSS